MDYHAELSPSGGQTWVPCPGSRRLSRGRPDTSSDAADEGTDAHELASLCLTLDCDAARFLGDTMTLGHVVDEEMVSGVQMYLDFVRSLPGDALIESWLPMERMTREPGGGGTLDYGVIYRTADEFILSVIDFKYGYVPVEVENNIQTLMYAAGMLILGTKRGDTIDVPQEVRLSIVQPRVYQEPQTWVITGHELIDWIEQVLVPAAIATEAEDAPLVPGEKQCRWCKAKGVCAALAEHAIAVVGSESVVAPLAPPAPSTLDDVQIAAVTSRADLVRSWLDAVEREELARLSVGRLIPGRKLVRGNRGKRTWSAEEDVVAAVLRENFKLSNETIYKLALQSPTTILKLPAVKENPDLLKPFITQAEGSLTAAPASDKRPAVQLAQSADAVFANVN